MAYFTYILRSIKTDRLYFGQTADLENRLREHNSGQTSSTAFGRPWELIFFKAFETRSEALALERLLKSWKNKQRILAWIERQKAAGP
jgi:putative endonuclease